MVKTASILLSILVFQSQGWANLKVLPTDDNPETALDLMMFLEGKWSFQTYNLEGKPLAETNTWQWKRVRRDSGDYLIGEKFGEDGTGEKGIIYILKKDNRKRNYVFYTIVESLFKSGVHVGVRYTNVKDAKIGQTLWKESGKVISEWIISENEIKQYPTRKLDCEPFERSDRVTIYRRITDHKSP